jgi:steroid delta-isomerase-like uncharacterized protein
MRISFILLVHTVLMMALIMPTAGAAEPTIDQNKARVRQFYDEVFNAGKLDLADQFIAADALDHEVMPDQKDPVPALANFKTYLADFRKAFPDLKVQVEDLVAEGDKVVARLRMTGTHKGTFNGVPATGKSFSIQVIDIIRLANGKCTEHWGISDDAGLMQQLGIMPPPAH